MKKGRGDRKRIRTLSEQSPFGTCDDSPRPPRRPEHAIVIGGSMAGLLAARVLAAHFDRVTILERDSFPEGPEFRKGVPQARHVQTETRPPDRGDR